MTKKMLIDAAHPEETRVVVVDGKRVDEFDFEASAKRQIRSNIYLARVTRVEPSLQAAFVEYGGNRHGFLAFNEIHPDYYQIPYEDRMKLLEEERSAQEDSADDNDDDAEASGEDDDDIASARPRRSVQRKYRIQEVIKRRQILLVQVVKEERGNKGAALTTYLSLAGRYCVLMPNTPRGGGISRKITSASDRKRLRSIAEGMEVPEGMGLIVRTAGAKRTKTEIKRDYDYLLRLWESIRERTLESVAPCLIHEEGNLVKRAIRDLYDKDIDEVLVQGDAAYREAKDFIRMLMPSHAKKVQPYRETTPLFMSHKVDHQLDDIFNPEVQLKSGGYLVINQTEALVAIDVNSGKATKERNIEATALKTNLEAAEEACRQFRLRDLAGLIVIDFIDMDEAKNNRAVEKRMRDCLKGDRARLQMGKISGFGLMELSRQRRRASLIEGSSTVCPHCEGRGFVRSPASSALHVLRRIEEEGLRARASILRARMAPDVALYIFNEKRAHLTEIEERCAMQVTLEAAPELIPPAVEFTVVNKHGVGEEPEAASVVAPEPEPAPTEEASAEGEEGGRKRRRRRRRRRSDEAVASLDVVGESDETGSDLVEESLGETEDAETQDASEGASEAGEDGAKRPRRRRGRRGGRGRRNARQDGEATPAQAAEASADPDAGANAGGAVIAAGDASDTAPASEGPTADADADVAASDSAAEPVMDEQPQPAETPEPDAQPTSEPAAALNGAEAPTLNGAANDGVPVTTSDVHDDGDEEEAPQVNGASPMNGANVIDPATAAPPDPEAQKMRNRWKSRIRSWGFGG